MRTAAAVLILVLSLTAPAGARDSPPAPAPLPRFPTLPLLVAAPQRAALWSDGRDLIVLRRGQQVSVLRRGRPLSVHALTAFAADPKNFTVNRGIAGSGVGEEAAFVLWDEEGHLEWFARGTWHRAQVPVPAGDRLSATVDGDGRVYVAGGDALQVYEPGQDGPWRQIHLPLPVPAPAPLITDIFLSPTGPLVLTSARRLLRLRDGAFTEVPLPALPDEFRGDAFWDSFYSAPSDTLWVLARRLGGGSGDRPQALLGFHLLAGTAAVYPLRPGGAWYGAEHLRGVHRAGTDLLAFVNQNELQSFDGEKVAGVRDWNGPFSTRPVRRPEAGEDDLALVARPGDEAVYMMVDGRLHRYQITETERHREAEALRERHRRAPITLPTLGVGLGPVWHFQPQATAAALALDVKVGAQSLFRKDEAVMVSLLPELLYAYDRTATLGGHYLGLGAGVGIGNPWVLGVYTPRFVIGLAQDGGVGIRHSLSLNLLMSTLTMELSHQLLFRDGQQQNDLRLMFTINPIPAIAVALFWSVLTAPFRWLRPRV